MEATEVSGVTGLPTLLALGHVVAQSKNKKLGCLLVAKMPMGSIALAITGGQLSEPGAPNSAK